MKAAIYKGCKNIAVEMVKKPALRSDSIIVRIKACGICGSDIRSFHEGLRYGIKTQIMGHEISGVVESAGGNVSGFNAGDRVAIAPDIGCGNCYYCKQGFINLCLQHRMIGTHLPGGFAEYIEIHDVILKRGIIHKMPGDLSFEAATLAEPLASVITAQDKAKIKNGDCVLIIGDGPVGCMHLEIARSRGASSVIISGLKKLNLAKRFNPDLLIDAGSEDTVEKVLDFTGGLGADVAICANPVASTQQQAVLSVKKRGRIIFFGGLPRENPLSCLDSNIIHYNELTILGSFAYQPSMHKLALEMVDNKKITPQNYIDMTVTLDEILKGFMAMEKGDALKVVVKP